MHINETAIRQQVELSTNTVALAIKNRATTPNWADKVCKAADLLVLFSKRVQTAQDNASHFGKHQAAFATREQAYRIRQSVTDKHTNLAKLKKYIDDQYKKILSLLEDEYRKNPADDKTAAELYNMLADNIDEFATSLSQHTELLQEVGMPRDIIRMPSPTATGYSLESLLFLLSFAARLIPLILKNKPTTKK